MHTLARRPPVHPGFCSRFHCDATELDARHSTVPTTVLTHPHGPELGVQVTCVDDDRVDGGPSGQQWVTTLLVPLDGDMQVLRGQQVLELDSAGRAALRAALDEAERVERELAG